MFYIDSYIIHVENQVYTCTVISNNTWNILYQQPTQYSLLIQLFPLMNICDDNQISGDDIPPSCYT